ncbi:unnamed protein product [Hermetia illucens]|uniref:Uncharacterized protein n=1 Tax=Hermetia illucens TaxID=343691 RepID=A0A7R8UCI0_HERIL|nr:unnamed protein product [Hermetia illucens]
MQQEIDNAKAEIAKREATVASLKSKIEVMKAGIQLAQAEKDKLSKNIFEAKIQRLKKLEEKETEDFNAAKVKATNQLKILRQFCLTLQGLPLPDPNKPPDDDNKPPDDDNKPPDDDNKPPDDDNKPPDDDNKPSPPEKGAKK